MKAPPVDTPEMAACREWVNDALGRLDAAKSRAEVDVIMASRGAATYLPLLKAMYPQNEAAFRHYADDVKGSLPA